MRIRNKIWIKDKNNFTLSEYSIRALLNTRGFYIILCAGLNNNNNNIIPSIIK